MGIATVLEEGVDSFTNTFINSASADLCSAIVPIALTGVTIYIILLGWAVMRGEAHDTFSTIFWKFFKISFISSIALGGGTYQSIIINAVQGLQGALIQSMAGYPTLSAAIDGMADPYIQLSNQYIPLSLQSTIPDFGLLFCGLIVLIAQAVILVLTIGFMLVAKVSLALVLAVGPIFILASMFPATRRLTESWAAQALHFVLLNSLLGAAIGMLTSFASQVATQVVATDDISNTLNSCVSLFIATCGLAFVVYKIDTLAMALTGGISVGNLLQAPMPRLSSNDGKNSDSENIKNNITEKEVKNVVSAPAANVSGTGGQSGRRLYNQHVLDNLKKAQA